MYPYWYAGSLLIVAVATRLSQVAFILFWMPGLSVAILTGILNIPEDLAALCVDPLKVFTFFGLTGDYCMREMFEGEESLFSWFYDKA